MTTAEGTARVLLFARLGEIAGVRAAEVPLGEGLTVRDLYDSLVRRHPALGDFADSVMYALNQEYVDGDHPVRPGDEIAFIPPVSGGSGAL